MVRGYVTLFEGGYQVYSGLVLVFTGMVRVYVI